MNAQMMSEYQIAFEKGLVNEGNLFRLNDVFQRAENGDRITIAFLGGSITQGAVSSLYTNCYANLVFQWFQKTFPKTAFTYVNAGIGGTSSQFGVARVDSDVLNYKPDLVFVEFSVNDENTDFYEETYEGLIRRIYKHPLKPAVILLHNMFYDNGHSAEEIHRRIGSYYELPSISMKATIYDAIEKGLLKPQDITPDNLHPNTQGHALLSQVIIYSLEQLNQRKSNPIPYEINITEDEIKPALTTNAYEFAVRLQNTNSEPVLNKFAPDFSPQKYITDIFRYGYIASEKGASVSWDIYGSEIAVQFRKSVNKPAPIAIAILDGDESNGVVLDANFDETWGDCLFLQTVAHHTEKKKHHLEIRIIETHENDVVPFYLVSVIYA